jgi:hypothetical protein
MPEFVANGHGGVTTRQRCKEQYAGSFGTSDRRQRWAHEAPLRRVVGTDHDAALGTIIAIAAGPDGLRYLVVFQNGGEPVAPSMIVVIFFNECATQTAAIAKRLAT